MEKHDFDWQSFRRYSWGDDLNPNQRGAERLHRQYQEQQIEMLQKRGFTQAEIAEGLGISRSEVRALVAGRRAWHQANTERAAAEARTLQGQGVTDPQQLKAHRLLDRLSAKHGIPRPGLDFKLNGTTLLGRYVTSLNVIQLNKRLLPDWKLTSDTLRHETAHAYVHAQGLLTDDGIHGVSWKRAARMMGARPEAKVGDETVAELIPYTFYFYLAEGCPDCCWFRGMGRPRWSAESLAKGRYHRHYRDLSPRELKKRKLDGVYCAHGYRVREATEAEIDAL